MNHSNSIHGSNSVLDLTVAFDQFSKSSLFSDLDDSGVISAIGFLWSIGKFSPCLGLAAVVDGRPCRNGLYTGFMASAVGARQSPSGLLRRAGHERVLRDRVLDGAELHHVL